MSYINSYGATAGPLKIDRTWISTITLRSDDNLYFTISADRDNINYRKLLAGTPNTSWDTDEDGKLTFGAPDNAVVTVGWIKATQSLDFSGVAEFYPDNFVTKAEYNVLVNDVKKMESSYNGLHPQVIQNTNDISILSATVSGLTNTSSSSNNKIQKIHSWIVGNSNNNYNEEYPKRIKLSCGNASSFANR